MQESVPAADAPVVTIRCDGHPNIKATHAKTFELTTDDTVTGAGTCIIGVKARYDEEALLRLRGAVRIHLQCGEATDTVLARVNPAYRRGDPLIVRRNAAVQPRTFCLSASKGSSALDRALVRALQRAGAELTVSIEPIQAAAEAPHGMLYVVGMPIGNPDDISLRAIDVLQSVDLVLAEDTRTTRAMLSGLGIRVDVLSYYDHNERARVPGLLARLAEGTRMALVSEAGMPLLSDPGFHLVAAAVEHGIAVTPVPGPDAVSAALAVAGISAADFRFIGFLPRKSGARRTCLKEFAAAPYALVLFEAPHRIAETLEDIAAVLPGRKLAVCRDLTKPGERVLRGEAAALTSLFSPDEKQSGELTVVIEGTSEQPAAAAETVSSELVGFIDALLASGCTARTIADALAMATGMPRRDAFALAVRRKEAAQGEAGG